MSAVFFGITDRLFHYERTVCRFEFSGTGINGAADLALASEGRIYVLNRGWEYRPISVRITLLTEDEDFISQFAGPGEGNGEFVWPTSIALDKSENVYVTDEWLNRVTIFDKDGNFLDKWGVAGSGDGKLNKPSGIDFDSEENLYLVDSGNGRVQKFTKDGKFLGKWGEEGNSEGQLSLPWGITVDNRGDVYVADWRNDRIQKFAADGEFLAEFGSSGNGVGQFNRPTGVAVDKYGDIYVADWGNNRVQALTAEGQHITTFTGQAGFSKWAAEKMNSNPDMLRQHNLVRDLEPSGRFWRPKAIEIDEQGRIWMLDSYRSRIQVYQRENY